MNEKDQTPESGCSGDSGYQQHAARAMESTLGVPLTVGNQVQILRNGDQIFPAMLTAIGNASRSIDLLSFVYWAGDIASEFAGALQKASLRGVEVRVLLDAVGARSISDETVALMVDSGCDVRWFRPLKLGFLGRTNNRTHRKILICDELVSFTGGVGIADEWLGDASDASEWRDTHFQISGPATAGLRAAFIENWVETGGPILRRDVDEFPQQPSDGSIPIQVISGAAGKGWTNISTMFRVLTGLSKERVRITTAYFSPDDLLLESLFEAAERGVEVEILLPGPHADKRFAQVASEGLYAELLSRGIKIWNYQTSMLHAKVFTVDGLVSAVGSANFNSRSVQHDEEVNLVIFDQGITSELNKDFDQDLCQSIRIDLDRWNDRGIARKVEEKIVMSADNFL